MVRRVGVNVLGEWETRFVESENDQIREYCHQL